MWANGLRRFAPQIDTRTEPKRASAPPPPELIPPELEAKMVAAFERARAERFAFQLPEGGADSAGDPWTRSNTAAFLVLERERRVVAARLSRHYRRRRDRYRDLILVTKLIHVEYEHLAGRAVESADSPSPSNGDTGGGDRPADWARPWGSGPLIEMGTALSFYQDQRDQLGKRLPTLSRGSAAAAAAGHRDRVLSRFEMVRGGRLGQEPLSAPPSERRAWPWKSPRFTRSAAAVACACVAIGAGAILGESGGPTSLDSNPTPVVASVPDALLAEPSGSQPPPGSRGDGSTADPPDRGNGADQVPVSAPVPLRRPSPFPPRSPPRPSPPLRPLRRQTPSPSRTRSLGLGPSPPCLPRSTPCPLRDAPEADPTARESPPGHDRCRRGPGARGGAGGARRPHSGRPGRRSRVHRPGRRDHLPGDGRRDHAPRVSRPDQLPCLPEHRRLEPDRHLLRRCRWRRSGAGV